jgi:hypothetical protein
MFFHIVNYSYSKYIFYSYEKEQNNDVSLKQASFDVSVRAAKQVCSQMFLSDNALISCNTSNIINITNLIALCELDYEVAPVNNIL